MAEALERHRILDGHLPFAGVVVDDARHVGFELGADAERVLADHLAHVVDAAFQVLEPGRSALQPVAGADVEHQEAVDVPDQRGCIEIARQQVRVPRLHAAIAADVEIPAVLGGDDADVLALRLGAFARAAGHRELDLVRRAQSLVAILEIDGEAHRVLHAVAAPGRTHAALHGAQRLAVGVAGFEAGVDQLAPDQRQLVHLRAEQVDALAAGDLGVQAVLLRDRADGDEPFRRDLAARHARHDRIRAVLLHVGEEVVVGVLQRRVALLQHELVPARGEDGRHRRLADVAAQAAAVLGDHVLEGLELADAHQVEQLLARVRKVLAHRGVDADAALLELGVEDLRHQRRAAAAGGAGLGLGLERADRGAAAFDGRAEAALGHVVAGTDLRGFRQRGQRVGRGCTRSGRARRKQHAFRVLRQRHGIHDGLMPQRVVRGVAHQHGAEQLLALGIDDQLLVDLAALVEEGVHARTRGRGMGVADGADFDAEQLELGAHVGAGEDFTGRPSTRAAAMRAIW